MNDEDKSKDHLVRELAEMRAKVIELENLQLKGQLKPPDELHKPTEKALKESEERYRLIFNHAPLGIMHFDQNGVIGDCNDKFTEIMGATKEKILGFNMLERLRDAEFLKAVKDAIRGDFGYYEGDYLSILGSKTTPLRAIHKRITSEDGRFLGAVGLFEDITERKLAEEALTSANQQLNDIIEFLPDATFVIDNDKKVIAWNRAIEEMTGVSKKDMIGKGEYAYSVPFYGEGRPSLLELIDTVNEELESKYEFVKRQCDILRAETYTPCLYEGKGAHVFATVTPLFNLRGNRVGAIESIRDISERKLAVQALKESQQHLADIINFLPDATLVIDKVGKVIAWNRAIEEMTEIKAQDILGKGNYEYALPFYGERRPILIDLVLRSQEEVEAEYVNVERKGSVLAGEAYMPALRGGEVYLYATATILRDSKGNIVGAIESIRDITERRRVEEALTLAEEKYRSIFENAIEGIYQTTVGGRFLSVNPAFARIFGYDSPEELMETITNISTQLYANPGRRSELLRLLEERGKVQEFEAQFLRKDRSIAWVSLNVRAVRDKGGKLAHLEGSAQDITDRKTLESRLIQTQKMEAIGTLAGGIAHDFNNILAAILGYTEMTIAKTDQPDLHGYLKQVLGACDRAKDLVGQILTFSRVKEQEKRPMDVGLILKEALKLLRPTLPSTIKFRSTIASGTDAVLADPTQIHQVLINLCTNAAYAMRESCGVIEVNLENVQIAPQIPLTDQDLCPGSYVKLTVGDTGSGIPAEIIHRIFDPFFTTKKTGEGTGLGLSVVYGIVKECGGAITVQSELGKGSVFSVHLPAIRHHTESKAEGAAAVPGGSEHILLLDDEEVLLEMWRHIFEDLGYKVTAATDSMKALEIFCERPDQFDLIITDMTMPGMTGIELSKEILELRADTPIIICTGFNELIDGEKARAMGIREFAMKPFNLRSIAELIRKTLEKEDRIYPISIRRPRRAISVGR
jgi:PAS domain S-box-containing protein